ncbi:adenylyl cyclase-associated protein 2-like [Acropora palmata]|uniref:adenylyl cyclase-associated protein 2-like n=1 Tax=Acropora palmata TaxID=6131 RepID=UPI003DA10EDC
MSGDLSALVARLEAVTTRLEAAADKTGGGASEDVGVSVEGYDKVLNDKVAEFYKLSAKIGGEVEEQVQLVKKAFDAQRQFIVIASKNQKPGLEEFKKLVKPTADAMGEAQNYREKKRSSNMFNHLSAVSEAIPALGWVTVSPTPAPYVKEMVDAAQFYMNRVLKDYKGKDDTHVEWVKCLKDALTDLQAYVKANHTTGLVWSKTGGVAKAAAAAAAAAPPQGPKPAAPPPPPIQAPAPVSSGTDQTGAANALFSEINKAGTNISAGLRKVRDDEKTHKNKELRKTGPVPDRSKPSLAPKPKAAAAVKKPPVFQLQGKKWVVEYQENNKDLVIAEPLQTHTVYIYSCKNSTIQVQGKINSLVVDNCKKTAVVLDGAIGTVEFINCQSAQCQINESVPTVSIDKTDGCQVFFPKGIGATEIVTAKSSEMNIMIPKPGSQDMMEFALPEQYKSTWNGKTFVTVCSESLG